ncbi:MAG: restriction endonuclease subunit S [Nitrospirales bacterium]
MTIKEFPQQFMSSWSITTLNELGQLYCGQSPSSSKVNRDRSGMLYVSGPEQWDGQRIRQEKWTTDPKRVVPKGCIFITVKGAGVGKIFPGISCAIGRDIYAFQPKDSLSVRFIEHAIRFTVQDILKHAAGDIPGLSKSHILQHKIGIPDLEEQERIVEEIEKQFSRLDEAVANLKRVKANLKRYKAAVLKAAVEGKLTEDWRKAHPDVEPASKLLDRILAARRKKWKGKGKYKEPSSPNTNNIGSLPNSWTWASLEQLCPRFVDSAHRTPHYGQRGVPALGPRDIVGGKLKLEDARRVEEEEFAIQTTRHVPEAGDIVYSRELSLGWGAIIPHGVRVCLSQGMCLFRPYKAVELRYFMFVLNGPHGRHQAELAATGSAHPHINLTDIKKYSIPLPSSFEQEQIVAEVERRLSVIDELEATVEANLTRANRLRQSILRRAFTGKLKGI